MPILLLGLIILMQFMSACSSQNISANQSYPSSFKLDVTRDILETMDGNTFVAHVKELNPVFGRALTIKVRGLKVESITDLDPLKVRTAFRQWHTFRRVLKESSHVEIRNLERGESGFWIWADVYLDGEILASSQ
ncbi:MAG: hypothetical protein P8P49_08850 [Opitutales bacterium]|nr:hypothetical protein [Opitutales bacterium]